MSEQEEPVVSIPKPKQYLLVVDDMGLTFLNKVIPSITFVEVHGMNMQGEANFQFLVTPAAPKVAEIVPPNPEEVAV